MKMIILRPILEKILKFGLKKIMLAISHPTLPHILISALATAMIIIVGVGWAILEVLP